MPGKCTMMLTGKLGPRVETHPESNSIAAGEEKGGGEVGRREAKASGESADPCRE